LKRVDNMTLIHILGLKFSCFDSERLLVFCQFSMVARYYICFLATKASLERAFFCVDVESKQL